MKTIHIGVTGINAIDNPGPGIGVARSLKGGQGPRRQHRPVSPTTPMDPASTWTGSSDAGLHPSASVVQRPNVHRPAARNQNARTASTSIIPILDAELPLYIKKAGVLADQASATFLPG